MKRNRHILIAALFALAYWLSADLGIHAGSLLTWECEVLAGFSRAFDASTSLSNFALERLRWGDGVLSQSSDSLLFGVPTYALFLWHGFTPTSLRIISVIGALGFVATLYRFVCKYFGPNHAIIALLVGVTSPLVLYYGRYGISLSITWLFVMLAIHATVRFVEAERPSVWDAGILWLALMLATYGYSPGRLIVLALLISISLVFLTKLVSHRLNRSALGSHAVLAILIATTLVMQSNSGGLALYVNGRGEQIFRMFDSAPDRQDLLGAEYRDDHGELAPLSLEEKLRMTKIVVTKRLVELGKLLSPWHLRYPTHSSAYEVGDPPELPIYLPWLIVLLVPGILVALRRWRECRHGVLLFSTFVALAPLLLTNRIDVHRLAIFVIPLTIWSAVGAEWWVSNLSARWGRLLQIIGWVGLIAGLAVDDRLLAGNYPPSAGMRAMGEAIHASTSNRQALVARGYCGDIAVHHLAMLESRRAQLLKVGAWIEEPLISDFERPSTDPDALEKSLQVKAPGADLIFYPSERYSAAIRSLAPRGWVAQDFTVAAEKATLLRAPATAKP